MKIILSIRVLPLVFIAILTVITLTYTFLPVTPLKVPSQEQYTQYPQIQTAISSVAALWNIPENQVSVFDLRTDDNYSISVSIIDTTNFASAAIWIPEREVKHNHSIAGLGPLDSDMHLLSQYIPKNNIEKIIAQNFYTKSKAAQANKAIITHVSLGFPFCYIRALSLTQGEFRYITVLTSPILNGKLRVDPY